MKHISEVMDTHLERLPDTARRMEQELRDAGWTNEYGDYWRDPVNRLSVYFFHSAHEVMRARRMHDGKGRR